MYNYFKYNISLLIKKEKIELIFCLVCERQVFMSKFHKSTGNRERSQFVQFRNLKNIFLKVIVRFASNLLCRNFTTSTWKSRTESICSVSNLNNYILKSKSTISLKFSGCM